jgi:HD-like signal output (HDOD) protein
MNPTLPELIASTHELATLPNTVIRLLGLLDDLTVDATRVMDIVDKDPSLTSNLLKLCNSAYYSLPRRIGSVKEAVVLLGNKTIVTLAFACGMGEVLRGPLSGYGLAKDEMWCHALATGLGASYIAGKNGTTDLRDRAFTAGLVHDIGKLLLDRLLATSLQQLPPRAEGRTLIAAERQIIGIDHCEAGAALAKAWNFPPMLVCAIEHHHEPELADSAAELVRAVAAADLIARSLGLGSTVTDAATAPESLEALTDQGIREETILHLVQQLPAEMEELLGRMAHPL